MKENKRKEMKEQRKYPNGIVGSDIVLIDGLEPTNIVVRVRDQMDVDFTRDNPLRGIVLYELGICAS